MLLSPRGTYYEIVGIPRGATDFEIKQAYKKKALELHPDKNPNGEAAFKRLRKAYEVLSDQLARQQYDATLPVDGHKQQRPSPTSSFSKPASSSSMKPNADTELDQIMKRDREMNNKKRPGQDFRSWYRQQQAEFAEQQRVSQELSRACKEQQAKEDEERSSRAQRFRDLEVRLQREKEEQRQREEVARRSEQQRLCEEQERQRQRRVDERWLAYEQKKHELEQRLGPNRPSSTPNPPKRDGPRPPHRPSVLDEVENCRSDREIEELLEARIDAILARTQRLGVPVPPLVPRSPDDPAPRRQPMRDLQYSGAERAQAEGKDHYAWQPSNEGHLQCPDLGPRGEGWNAPLRHDSLPASLNKNRGGARAEARASEDLQCIDIEDL